MLGKLQYIFFALPKRWHLDRKYAESVKEILAKFTIDHEFLQVPVGRSNNPRIDRPGDVVTNPFKLAFLQDT